MSADNKRKAESVPPHSGPTAGNALPLTGQHQGEGTSYILTGLRYSYNRINP